MSTPSRRIWPSVTSYAGWPAIAYARVDLPEPFGPMTACTSPDEIVRSTPLTIGVPSSRATCRFFSSSVAKIACSSVLEGKADTGLARPLMVPGPPLANLRRPVLCVNGKNTETLVRWLYAEYQRPRDHPAPDRRPAALRREAPPGDRPVARDGNARVQGLRLGQQQAGADRDVAASDQHHRDAPACAVPRERNHSLAHHAHAS